MLVAYSSYGVEEGHGYGTFGQPENTSYASLFTSCTKKGITCLRLTVPLVLISVPLFLGFVAERIHCFENDQQNGTDHGRIGDLMQQLLHLTKNGAV